MFADHRMKEPRKSKHPTAASAEGFSGEVCGETEMRPETEQGTQFLAPTNNKCDFKAVLKDQPPVAWRGYQAEKPWSVCALYSLAWGQLRWDVIIL